jgi:hypothetical protein
MILARMEKQEDLSRQHLTARDRLYLDGKARSAVSLEHGS